MRMRSIALLGLGLVCVILGALAAGSLAIAPAHADPALKPAPPPLPVKRSPPPETPTAKPKSAEPDYPKTWSDAEIITAQRRCMALLATGTYDIEPLEPIRKGECGTPAPIRLTGIRSSPEIVIRPAATLTCAMATHLREWIERVVQPTAMARLKARIVSLHNISSYVCRHRYSDPTKRISQHALASALDIAEFQTAKGERISVLKDWDGDGERAGFLHDVHRGACRIFDTVLGPDANAAHKNHFHLDLSARHRGVCE